MTEVFRMKAAGGDGLELQRYEDIIYPVAGGADPIWGIKHAKEFKYRHGDILICSYPKSGTHWMINMAWKLKTFDISKRPKDTGLEIGPAEIFESMESPRIIFTHLKPSRLPSEHIENKGKIILMLRNPKDAMVSMYHNWKDAVILQNKQTWDEFFQSFIIGETPCGSYFDYVHQWEQFLKEKSTAQHIEIFYYEDFKTNLNYNITRLNNFLGFNRDEQYIEKVMEETTLSALRQQDTAGDRETHVFVMDKEGKSLIYRKGEVGDWKNYLTMTQSEIVDKLMEERLKHGLINVKYEI